MRNKGQWRPSKYIYRKGKLIGSRDPKELAVGSRLIADSVAYMYDIYIPKYAKGRLVDLGCGKVPLFEAYRNHITDNVCVDWENTLHKNEFLDFEYDLSKEMPFDDDEFDTIILSDVLEHIPDPERIWREMSRILAPQGVAIINVPFYYWLHETPHDYYRFSEYALRRLAIRNNFTILILKPIGGTPEILADLLAKHFQTLPIIGRGLAGLTQGIIGSFVKMKPGRSISKKTSRRFPLGYFLVAEKLNN